MKQIIRIALENEMDLMLAHRRAMKLAELCSLSVAIQTSFATAVSEIARSAIAYGQDSYLVLGIITQKTKLKELAASICNPVEVCPEQSEALKYAKRLVNDVQLIRKKKIVEVTLQQKINFSGLINDEKIDQFIHYFKNEKAVSAYDEIRKKNIHLLELSEKLRESESQYKVLTDSLPLMMFTVSPIGKVIYANQWFRDYFGFSNAELETVVIKKLVHPDDEQQFVNTITQKNPFNFECRFHKGKSEDDRWFFVKGMPNYSSNKHLIGVIITAIDIHERKNGEEELILANKIAQLSLDKRNNALKELTETKEKLEETMKVKERFLSNMSHEIRTPMNAIIGFTDIISKTELAPDQKQYINAIKISGENLLVVINDILDFTKLQADAIRFEKISFRLSQLMSTLVELMLPKSTEKSIKLSVAIDKEIPEHLIGDPTRLNQVLLNLVGNAIKFTETGEVKMAVRLLSQNEESVELRFDVEDTGIGIAEQKVLSIFDEFTQATNETTRKYGGSGLGLAIVKQYVEKQGGEVFVSSVLGAGSVFSFTIRYGKDLNPPSEKQNAVLSEEATDLRLEGLDVLLVEDNHFNQMLAMQLMTKWKWNIVWAENGLIAIEKLQEQHFDIVLMDIQLPEMDGYQATRHIRNKFPAPLCNVPIMAMTAHAMSTEEDKCLKEGMDDYISKPFSSKVLYSKIVLLVERKRAALVK